MNRLGLVFSSASRRWARQGRRRRLAWVGLAGVVTVLLVTTGISTTGLLRAWQALNALFLARVAWWALWNPRQILGARATIARWSLVPAGLLALVLHAFLERWLTSYTDTLMPVGVFFLSSLLLALPVTFTAAVVLSATGAAVGGFVAREGRRQTVVARVGVAGVWLTLGVVLLLRRAAVLLGLPAITSEALLSALPLFTLWLVPLARRLESESAGDWAMRILRRCLVWRYSLRGSRRSLDLRGVACAAAGVAVAATLAGIGLLASPQASVQAWLTAQHQAVLRLLTAVGDQVGAGSAPRLVLLEWDNAALRRACAEDSESAVQAKVIQRLGACGALGVVVPPPTLELPTGPGRWAALSLPLGAREVGNNERDLRLVCEALAATTNAILALPAAAFAPQEASEAIQALEDLGEDRLPENLPRPGATNVAASLGALRSAAHRTGSDSLPSFRGVALPVVPLGGQAGVPAPVPLLAAALADGAAAPQVEILGRREARVDGRVKRLIDDASLLVDFSAGRGAPGFLRVPVSALLDDQPVYEPAPGGHGGWKPAGEVLQGRLAFLEAVVPHVRATPLGEMSRIEVLAHATQTLLDHKGVLRLPEWQLALESLAAASLAAFWCYGAGLAAGMSRVLVILVFLWAAGAAGEFNGVAIDPVFPSAAVAVTFLLLAQLSLAVERQGKDQNRSILQRFVAPEFVESVMEDPDARLTLGGQRERVAILFADVRGFSRFAEEHPPEEVIKVVNAYLQVMTDALHQHGGLLDKYTGDGLMALFRIGHQGDQGLVAAVRGGLAMRDAALRLSSDRAAGGDKSLQVGIGLHVGEPVLGFVGNATRQVGYTALGHAVVVAARLQALAMGGEMIISEDVRSALGDRFDLIPREPVQLKGVSAPLRCHRVLSAKPPVAYVRI